MKRPSPLALVLLLGFFLFSLLIFAAGLGLGYSWGWRAASQTPDAAVAAETQAGASLALPAPGTAPQASTPQVRGPQVQEPQLRGPQVTAPSLSGTNVTGPRVTAPQVNAPRVTAPRVTEPRVTTPSLSQQTLGGGRVTLPATSARPSDLAEVVAPEPAASQATGEEEAAAGESPARTTGLDATEQEAAEQEATRDETPPEEIFESAAGSVGPPLRLYTPASPDAEGVEGVPAPSEAGLAAEVRRFAGEESVSGESNFFAVELAIYSDRRNAALLAEELVGEGRRPLVVTQPESNAPQAAPWYSVTLGRFATRGEAERLRDGLRRDRGSAGRVVLVSMQPE